MQTLYIFVHNRFNDSLHTNQRSRSQTKYMNISPLLGVHTFVDGKITIRNKSFRLQIAPLTATTKKQPNFQLIYKDQDSPFHDQRISGLWSNDGIVYRGSVPYRGNQKHYFTISCSDTSCKIERWKKG